MRKDKRERALQAYEGGGMKAQLEQHHNGVYMLAIYDNEGNFEFGRTTMTIAEALKTAADFGVTRENLTLKPIKESRY